MRALILSNNDVTFRSDYPRPEPEAGEALIAVRLAGICATDLELMKGYLPFTGVLGHEFVGEVVAVGDATAEAERWIGQRVVGGINVGCGSCDVCLASGPEHCPRRIVLGIQGKDGVFAEYVTLPLANLLAVPDEVADERAVFTEPLAAALRICEQVTVRPTTKTAVIGPGRLGLLIGQVLAQAGTNVTMLGRRRETLDLPAQLGLTTGLTHDFPDDQFDFVVEATGNEDGFSQALRLTRPLGTVVLKSTFADDTAIDLTKLVVSEINVVGSRCGPFAPALRLLAGNRVDVAALIDAQYPLDDGEGALAHAARPGVRKVLLRP